MFVSCDDMKEKIIALLRQSISSLSIPFASAQLQLTRTKDATHGDFATNIALLLAKSAQLSPRDLAEKIVAHIPTSSSIQKIEIAGPGFINFFLAKNSEHAVIAEALQADSRFGYSDVGKEKRIHIEFVSANPTGPLHVGHGRGAAYGACVSNLLDVIGCHVHREYYVNDAGRQMRILGASIWLRYAELLGQKITIPLNAYRGDYVIDIAKKFLSIHAKKLLADAKPLFPTSPDTEETKDAYIDQLVENIVRALGADQFEIVRQFGVDEVTDDIKNDLEEFGVKYNTWFKESELTHNGALQKGIEILKTKGFTYEKEGALWFRATEFGDEKDRVLIRANGVPTYFASDVAYHSYKYDQGYNEIIDVLGADHHGYHARIRAFLTGLGKKVEQLKILTVQFAILYRGQEKVSMSTRSGEFVTLRALRFEVGNDAARFFYVMRKPDQHLDFDLELAKSTSSENPVYYIQYAHARARSVWRQLKEKNIAFDQSLGLSNLSLLSTEDEKKLVAAIAQFKELIVQAALQYAPHRLAHFLQEFAHCFHTYYHAVKFIVDDAQLRNARLCLMKAAEIVLKNGLTWLGVSAPESM